jgi:hypothetical protein
MMTDLLMFIDEEGEAQAFVSVFAILSKRYQTSLKER